MGNVHAYSSAPPPPPPPGMSPFAPKVDKEDTDSAASENPGPLEEIHTKCKSK